MTFTVSGVALFTRAWIEIKWNIGVYNDKNSVALFTRAWIEIAPLTLVVIVFWSPSSRGRGLKYRNGLALVTRNLVALFTRAWIEIEQVIAPAMQAHVALFTRAWIEINACQTARFSVLRRPLHEGVD